MNLFNWGDGYRRMYLKQHWCCNELIWLMDEENIFSLNSYSWWYLRKKKLHIGIIEPHSTSDRNIDAMVAGYNLDFSGFSSTYIWVSKKVSWNNLWLCPLTFVKFWNNLNMWDTTGHFEDFLYILTNWYKIWI